MKHGTYINLQNCATLGYLSNSVVYKNKEEQSGKMFIPECTSRPLPSDVYKLEVVSSQKVWSINSVVSFELELRGILANRPEKGSWSKLLPNLT